MPTPSRRYLGLDLGTSGLKGLLVGQSGRALGRARADYPTRRAAPGHAEQSPRDWLAAIGRVVRELVPDGRVSGVALSGHTPSLVATDADRGAVFPALIWQDVRASAEAAELAAHFGDEESIIGGRLPWNAAYLPAKLLWLARHGLGPTRWLYQPKDAANFALTGVAATDPWGSKGLSRIDTGLAVTELFAYAGVPRDLLPPRLDAWARLGTVDDTGARWSGLAAGTPVAVGWTDALAGMLGVGAFAGPRAFVLTGTSDIAGVSGDDRPVPSSLLHVPRFAAPLPVSYGPTQTAGAAVRWLADVAGTSEASLIASSLAAHDDQVPVFVPYLDGERAPVWRTDVRASLTGVGLRTGRAELARAVLRGVALSDRHVLSMAGLSDEPVHVGGTSGQADGWLRARTETLGVDLIIHREPDMSALGAAMLAAIADGLGDVTEVSTALAGEVETLPATDREGAAAHYARYLDAAGHATAD